MTAGEGLADSILYLVDTISHLREPSHAPACPTPGCPSHRPRPALHPPRLAQRIAKSPRDGALRVTPSAWRATNRATCASMAASRKRSTITHANTTPPGSPNWANTPADAGGRLRRELQHQRLERSRRLPRRPRAGRHRAAGGVPGAHALLETQRPLRGRRDVPEGAGVRAHRLVLPGAGGRRGGGWRYPATGRTVPSGLVAVAPVRGAVRQAGRRRAAAPVPGAAADAILAAHPGAAPGKGQVEDWGPRLEGAPARPRRPGRPEEAPTAPAGRNRPGDAWSAGKRV